MSEQPTPREVIVAELVGRMAAEGMAEHVTKHILAALTAAGYTICEKQVGIWFPDDNPPERMSRSLWEQERLVSLWTVADEGGLVSEFADLPVPVFVPVVPEAPQ